MTGPQRARLDQGLTGAQEESVRASAQEWNTCTSFLHQISMALLTASPAVKERIGGQTGPAVDAAFTRASQGMTAKAAELVKGATALNAAAEAIAVARAEQEYLAKHPLTEPTIYTAPGQATDKELKREATSRQAHHEYQAAYADQETRAQKKADHMDKVFAHSTAVMKEIHGEPDPEPTGTGSPQSSGSGAPGGGGGSPHTSAPSSHHGVHENNTVHWVPNETTTTTTPTTTTTTTTTTTPTTTTPPVDVPTTTGVDDGGSSQGNVPLTPPVTGETLPTAGGSTGVSGGTGLGLAGAAAGGVGGGLLGTSMATGGLRGGVAPISAGGGTAASGVRGIGATSRSGVSGSLGRSGGTGTAGAGAGTAGRGAGAAGAGRGTAARGAGARGGSGSRGAAGGRGAAAGGGAAGGRSGRGKGEKEKGRHPEFDDSEDWVDDEDIAPGVID